MASGARTIKYEEMHKIFSLYMRRSLVIYDFAPDPSEFLITVYEENFIFLFISVLQYIRVRFQHREETFLHIL